MPSPRYSAIVRALRRAIAVLLISAAALAVVAATATATDFGIVSQLGGTGAFSVPAGVVADGTASFYVVDYGSAQIKKFGRDGALIRSWGHEGTGQGDFVHPFGIDLDGAGNVYVTDSGNNRVEKFSPDGEFMTAWGSTGSGPGQFSAPTGIAVDPSGTVYVADAYNGRIQRFSPTGQYLGEFGSNGSGGGQLLVPYDVAVGQFGNLYVADTQNDRISVFAADGSYIKSFGRTGGQAGRFSRPFGVTTDAAGDVFVADHKNNRIQRFSADGLFVEQFAVLTAGNPVGIDVDPSGMVLVTDSDNARLNVFGQPPTTPGTPHATPAVGNGAPSIDWAAATSPNSAPIAYKLERRVGVGDSWSTVATGLTSPHYPATTPPEPEGSLTYRVTASVGLLSGPTSAESTPVVVDRGAPGPPTLELRRPVDYAADGGWFKDSITVTPMVGSDPALPDGTPGSGVDPASLAAPQAFASTGAHTASSTETDRAGNTSAQASTTVQVDASDPALTATATVDGTAYHASSWSNRPVTVAFHCSDTGSGVAAVSAPLIMSGEGATQVAKGSCSDHVGHTAAVEFGPIRIDKGVPGPPQIDVDRPVDYLDGAGVPWYKSAVNVSFEPGTDVPLEDADEGSGVDDSSLPAAVVVDEEGERTVSGTEADRAGNTSVPASLTLAIDTTAPEVALECPGPLTVGDTAVAQSSAQDDGAGLAETPVDVPLDTTSAGERVASFTADDHLGNTATASCTYDVSDPPPVVAPGSDPDQPVTTPEPPIPTPDPPPVTTPNSPPATAKVLIRGGRLRLDRRGRAGLRVKCVSSAKRCKGSVMLASRGARGASSRMGSSRFSIRAGGWSRVVVKLKSPLTGSKQLRAIATAKLDGGDALARSFVILLLARHP